MTRQVGPCFRTALAISSLALTLASNAFAQAPATGLGPEPIWASSIRGDFVVGSNNTRVNFAGWPGVPQVDNFPIVIFGIPPGADVQAAYANWTYLSNVEPRTSTTEGSITLNGYPIEGTVSGSSGVDLCWALHYGVSYVADVTRYVRENGTYLIKGAIDKDGSLGEGMSIVVVYTYGEDPMRDIYVYSGYVSTKDASPTFAPRRGGLNFGMPEILNTATAALSFTRGPYVSGPAKFFINALDGQTAEDHFSINGTQVGGILPGTSSAADAWVGLVGPGGNATMYDQALGDVAPYLHSGDRSLTAVTNGWGDCVGHSMAAISIERHD